MYIQKLPYAELLAGLAEECTELAQAALKLRRAYDKTNPTPKTVEECRAALIEEVADVNVYLLVLNITRDLYSESMMHKIVRWEDRLKNQFECEVKPDEGQPGKDISPQV